MLKIITKKIRIHLLTLCSLLLLGNCNKEAIVAENTDYFGIKYDPGNGIFPVGTVQSNDDNFYIFGNLTNKANGSQDAFVMKVDENLKIIWNKTFGGNKNDEFTSMAIDDNGNLLAVGTSNSFGSSVDSNYTFSNSRFYMVYLDKDGKTIWEKTHQANNDSEISNRDN